jgi:hypothetical protein
MTGPVKFVAGIALALVAAIVGARFAYEAGSAPEAGPANQPWATDRMEFLAWNGARWTAWVRDGQFELVPQNSRNWHRHSNPTIALIDWDGDALQAKIQGGEFLLAHHGEWHGQAERSAVIRYRDWDGNRKLRTVEQLIR